MAGGEGDLLTGMDERSTIDAGDLVDGVLQIPVAMLDSDLPDGVSRLDRVSATSAGESGMLTVGMGE